MYRLPSPAKVGDHGGDVLTGAVPTEGGQATLLVGPGAVGRVHVRVRRAGVNQVGRDPTLAEIAGNALGQPYERRLAHRVEGDPGRRHPLSEAAPDAEDPPAVRMCGTAAWIATKTARTWTATSSRAPLLLRSLQL